MSLAGAFAMQADRSVCGSVVVLTCLFLSVTEGCRERPTTVSGVVALNGQPLVISRDTRGTVLFEPDGGQGTLATGLLDPSGHFKLAVGSSLEVPPGKYRVAISVSRALSKSDQEEDQAAEFVVPRRYASTRESGLQAKVVPGENKFQFDVTSGAEEGSSNSVERPGGAPEASGAHPETK